jgi:hypothetical protein
MTSEGTFCIPPALQPVVEEFLPLFRGFAQGRYAVSVGGSYGKGSSDAGSDVDFRLYADRIAGTHAEIESAISSPMKEWAKRGIQVDGVWSRSVAEVDAALAGWLAGTLKPDAYVWTIWGYHLLPDLYYQKAIEDPFGLIAGWKEKIRVYPKALKEAILNKHMASLRYWRNDYHYVNKVRRQDIVFLAGLSARLVHDIMQVLFAVNEVYFVGDGQNLEFAAQFTYKPRDLDERIRRALNPPPSRDVFEKQRDALISLIDDIEQLVMSRQ